MSININKVKEEDGFDVSSGVITMKIGKFSEFKIGARKVSQINFIRGLPWKICVRKNEKFLQYFLQCNAESRDGNWACPATAILKMLAQKEGKANIVREIKHNFHAKDNIWGFAEFVSSEALMNPENGWYDEATDSIILSTEINAGLPHGIETQCRISEDLCLFENRDQYSDCILVSSDGVKFNAYKGILACRSPVFAAMFQTNMVELQNGIVQIDDIKSDVLEQMLRYIYSGPNFTMKNMAEELLIASEKYQLIRLKMLCERELAHCLNDENACAFLVLASQYSAKHLEEKTIEYIQKHANEVTETEGWQILLKGDYEEVVHQIVKAIIERGND